MSSCFDAVRSAAASHSACPICLDSLASQAEEVGALTFRGRRVEAALYHRSCVGIRATGGLPRLPGGCSPITRTPVDGFVLMPPLRERRRWIEFVDWNGDGEVSVSELASAIAGMLPVDEDAVEKVLRLRFLVSGDVFCEDELLNKVLPHLESQAGELAASAPSNPPPELSRHSTRAELLAWFKYWDADGSGTLDAEELHFAIATLFFHALGSVDLATKEAVFAAFLSEAALAQNTQVTKTGFLENLAPTLQANLPAGSAERQTTPTSFRLKLVLATTGASAEVQLPGGATIGDLRQQAVQQLGPGSGAVELISAGRRIGESDEVSLGACSVLCREGAVVQVLLRSMSEESDRLRRMREEVQREREALRREREDLERKRAGQLFADGTRVTLQGLQSTPELNGRSATILRFENGRYIVEVDGPGGGQKSLRPETLRLLGEASSQSASTSFMGTVGSAADAALASLKAFLAGYEWWQLLIGAAVLLVIFGGYFQNSHRQSYASSTGSAQQSRRHRQEEDWSHPSDRYAERMRDDRNDYSDHYEHGGNDFGLFPDTDRLTLLVIAIGFGYACWAGIIPIRNLNFWQCMMLWNMIQPLLFGGRGRGRRSSMGSFGGGYGGLGGFGGVGYFGGFGRRGFF